MLSYGLRLGGAAVAILLLGVLALWVFSELWVRLGLVAALVIVFGIAAFFLWRTEQRDRASREGLERI